jgi:hypothetical protein
MLGGVSVHITVTMPCSNSWLMTGKKVQMQPKKYDSQENSGLASRKKVQLLANESS